MLIQVCSVLWVTILDLFPGGYQLVLDVISIYSIDIGNGSKESSTCAGVGN